MLLLASSRNAHLVAEQRAEAVDPERGTRGAARARFCMSPTGSLATSYTEPVGELPAFLLLDKNGALRPPTEEDGVQPCYLYRDGAYRFMPEVHR
jgi:hypothetical protein